MQSILFAFNLITAINCIMIPVIEQKDGHLYAYMYIDNKKCLMLIDTGSNTSHIDSKGELSLSNNNFYNIRLGFFCKSKFHFRASDLSTINAHITRCGGVPINGIIGTDILSLINADIDVGNNIMLYGTPFRRNLDKWRNNRITSSQNDFMITIAKINGCSNGFFKIDTGTMYTIVKERYTSNVPFELLDEITLGSTGNRVLTIKKVAIKYIEINNNRYTYGYLHIAPFDVSGNSRFADNHNHDGVIGLDFLKQNRTIISFRANEMPEMILPNRNYK